MTAPFQLTVSGEGIGQLTFNTPNEKVNKFSLYTLVELEQILEEAVKKHQVKVMIIKSGKEGIFIAGADLNMFREAEHNPELMADIIRTGHKVFEKLQKLPFPTIALIDGVCLGGGTEFALACTYRMATDNPKTSIGLPEVTLGIIPGWGGTQRLPRLVGLQNALKLILSGSPVDGKKAYQMGLVDLYVPKTFAEERALEMARQVMTESGKNKILQRRKKSGFMHWFLEKTPIGRMILFSQAKKDVLEKTKGHYPAPLVALDLVKKTWSLPLAHGLVKEQERFLTSDGKEFANASNLINLFFIQEALKKQPEATTAIPRPISMTGVIGAGTMGGGIAWLFSYRDYDVRMKDVNWDAVGLGYSAAHSIYKQLVKKKKLKPCEAELKFHKIGGTVEYAGFKNTDLIIEAAVENLDVKRKIFAELESIVPSNTIIASNTSSLTIRDMARDMKHPERFVGMHFFNPVNRMPLVEVVAGPKTSPEAVATAVETCKKLKKTPIVVGDCPGFLVNRIFITSANEVLHMLGEGVPMKNIERALLNFGMPMSPFLLIDEVGGDVTYKVAKTLHEAYGDRMTPAPIIEKIYESKLFGKKVGKGFYIQDKPNPEIQKFITKTSNLSDQEIVQRTLLIMINEATRCLEEGVVKNPGYLDMAMIMGTGFPPFQGGLLRYADNQGISWTVSQLRELSTKYGSRFDPSNLLLKYEKEGRRFY